ncbi:MAG TPA: Lrp/AsnC family transcriptional regulator [Actinobacteria bacterium]|jgi:DNA-binding Lrp family transcriptional regulator|nr:Lrp/AsnC family transcriptional regulator [Actinomycetota bacterium]
MALNRVSDAGPAGQMAGLDDVDRLLVAALRADGRLSMRALAERLHISRASAYARTERLERSGVITGYTATIDPQRYGYGLSAYVYLKISQQTWKSVRQQMLAIPEVEQGALVGGENDIVLLVRTRDAASLRDLVLTRFHEIPEVLSTRTELIFDELPLAPLAPPDLPDPRRGVPAAESARPEPARPA